LSAAGHPGAPAPAPTAILVSGAARETGILATVLFKSTGYRFEVTPHAGGAAVRRRSC